MRQISPARGAFLIYITDSDHLKSQVESLRALESVPRLFNKTHALQLLNSENR